MCDKHTILLHSFNFFFVWVYAMSHNCLAVSSKQSKLIICVSIKFWFWTQFLYPWNFAIIFWKMRLHRNLIFFLNIFQFTHQFICTAWYKSRSQNRFCMLVLFLLYFFKPRDCFVYTFFCFFSQIIRWIAIHVHFTNHRSKPGFFKHIHQ